MMSGFQPQGARYGIWGENPYGPTVEDSAFGMAKNINGLFQQKYQQQANQQALQGTDMDLQKQRMMLDNLPQQQDVANQMAQQNLQKGQLGLQTDQFNYGRLQQQADLGDDAARAKIGLLNAQANQANGKDFINDPVAKFQRIYSQYQSADPDSPQKMFYGTLLDGMMGGAGGATGVMGAQKSGTGTATGQSGVKIGPNGSIVNPGSVGARSNKGMSYATTDADGNPVTYESPTMGNSTVNQNRLASAQEADVLVKPVLKGLAPYQGALGTPTGSLLKDSLMAAFGNQDSQNRLNALALAQKLGPEAAAVVGRMAAGGQIGIETVRELQNAIQQGTPPSFLMNHLLNQQSLNDASNKYLGIQQKGVQLAAQPGRNNYPISMPNTPEYAQQTPASLGYFTRGAMSEEKQSAYDSQQQAKTSSPSAQTSDALPSHVTDEALKQIADKRGISLDEARRQAIAYYGGRNGR